MTEASRFAAGGFEAVMFDAVGSCDVAARAVARWSGRALDPAIAAVFLDTPPELLRISDPDDLWGGSADVLSRATAGADPPVRTRPQVSAKEASTRASFASASQQGARFW